MARQPTVQRLIEALRRLRSHPSKRAKSEGLQSAWPEWGRSWIVQWANELDRDMATIAVDLEAAQTAGSLEAALTPTENALWRLDAAREKLHAIIALAFGVPSLTMDMPRKTMPFFRPDAEATRERLRGIEHEQARRVLDADATLKSCLLLRHQLTHRRLSRSS